MDFRQTFICNQVKSLPCYENNKKDKVIKILCSLKAYCNVTFRKQICGNIRSCKIKKTTYQNNT